MKRKLAQMQERRPCGAPSVLDRMNPRTQIEWLCRMDAYQIRLGMAVACSTVHTGSMHQPWVIDKRKSARRTRYFSVAARKA